MLKMTKAEQMFLWNCGMTLVWAITFFFAKISSKEKGFTPTGALALLLLLLAVPGGMISLAGMTVAWRESSWAGRVFGFIIAVPSLIFLARALNWTERLPFGL